MATSLVCCGFECGVAAATAHWTFSGATPPTFSTTTVRNGARALNFSGQGQATLNAIAAGGNKFVARFSLLFPDLTSQRDNIFGATDSTTFFTGLNFNNSTNTIEGQLGSNNSVLGGIQVEANRWYTIDLKIDISANPWTISVKVDGNEMTGSNPIAAGTFTGQFRFGSTGNTNTMSIDDFIISSTVADYPFGYGRVLHFVPTADGTHNGLAANEFERTLTGTDITGATTDSYLLIDDVPLESGTPVDFINLIAPSASTDYVENIFGPASGVPIPTYPPRAVEVIVARAALSTTGNNLRIALNDNGTTDDIVNATVGSTTCVYSRKHYLDPPSAASVWTLSGNGNFNNIRVRCFTSDANPDPYFVSAMIEAEFAEPQQKVVQVKQAVNRSNTY